MEDPIYWIEFINYKNDLPSFLLSSMSANKPILMICQSRPRTRCGFPSLRSSAPMFTTWHPMAEAEFRARLRFSCRGRGARSGGSDPENPLNVEAQPISWLVAWIPLTRASVTHLWITHHQECIPSLKLSGLLKFRNTRQLGLFWGKGLFRSVCNLALHLHKVLLKSVAGLEPDLSQERRRTWEVATCTIPWSTLVCTDRCAFI